MEEVECAECGNRYDSSVQTFCTRCGNDGARKAAPAALAAAAFDPARRRARIGGVILATMGAFALLNTLWAAIAPADLDAAQLDALADIDLFASQPGGDLSIRIMDNGTPLVGHATVGPVGGPAVHNASLEAGWFNATGLATAFGNLTVAAGNVSWQWSYYVPEGQSVRADLETDDAGTWVSVDEIPATRIIAGFMAFFAAFVVLAGIAAIRLRWRGIAIAGAIMAAVPTLLMVIVVPIAGLILALPTVLALGLIVQGRRHFG